MASEQPIRKDRTESAAEDTTEDTAEALRKLTDRLKETAMDTGRRARELLTTKNEEMKDKVSIEDDEDPQAIRGMAGMRNIMGAFPSVTEEFRSKRTQPADMVEETRAVRERGITEKGNEGDVAPITTSVHTLRQGTEQHTEGVQKTSSFCETS